MIIYGTIFILSYKWLIGLISSITGVNQLEAGFVESLLYILLLVAGFLLLLIVCYLAFTVFGGLITAPFNEKISRLIEKIVTNKGEYNLSFWKDTYISIKAEAQKLIFYFVILFTFFLFNFIPAVGGLISFSLGILFSFYYNALDFLDYPMTRRQVNFIRKLKIVKNGGMLTYGFGCMAFMMMFLPVVNVFMKPMLVVAGTSLYFERKLE